MSIATLEHAYLSPTAEYILRLREISLRGLRKMYCPRERMFCWCVRREADGTMRAEGRSRRYTAIAVIGLAREKPETVQSVLGAALDVPVRRILADIASVENLGDAALTLWAARAAGSVVLGPALDRLKTLLSRGGPVYTVELSWALTALSLIESREGVEALRRSVADRLIAAWSPQSRLFPHQIGGRYGLRAHVSCFADLVYPTQALALYTLAMQDERARDVTAMCANAWAWLQGPAGQWWWHYDVRTGRVIERYPVYSVHQDAMGPMALFAAEKACGIEFREPIERGLKWLSGAPELSGGTLVDDQAGMIWRKVARREPGKLARTLQALASGLHASLRVPGLDGLLPPGAIDYECRPYHLGWLLYAFPERRAARWRNAEQTIGGKT